MSRRPTINDLARRAGVSVATVDRVLNGRHKVREETARRVYEAATEIGYHAASLIRQRLQADLPEVVLGAVLQRREQPFYQAFARELARAVEETPGVRGRLVLEFARESTPGEVAGLIEHVGARAAAVAVTAMDHHAVSKAVETLRARGRATFSLLSDFAPGLREAYVGLNNVKVGRSAAWLIANTAPRPGRVAIFVGSHRWHGHELRETGFRSFFREYAPQFEVLEAIVNFDAPDVTREAVLRVLDRHPDVAGFYVAGGGMEGALAALREEAVRPLPRVVVNEATPESIAALQDGLVSAAIATPLPRLCRVLVDMMLASVRGGLSEATGQVFLPFDLLIPESV